MNPLPLAEFDARLLGILIPVSGFAFVISILLIRSKIRMQRNKLWHETARLALEKGQPIPIPPSAIENDPVDASGEKQNSVANDIRTGLILLAIAGGSFFSKKEGMPLPSAAYYVTGFLGLAFLINAAIGKFLHPADVSKETNKDTGKS